MPPKKKQNVSYDYPSVSSLWESFTSAQKNMLRRTFGLNNELSVIQIANLLSAITPQQTEVLVITGKRILALFLVNFDSSEDAMTHFSSPAVLATYLESEDVLAFTEDQQEKNDRTLSTLFSILLCFSYTDSPTDAAATIIKNSNNSHQAASSGDDHPDPSKMQFLVSNVSKKSTDRLIRVIEDYVVWFRREHPDDDDDDKKDEKEKQNDEDHLVLEEADDNNDDDDDHTNGLGHRPSTSQPRPVTENDRTSQSSTTAQSNNGGSTTANSSFSNISTASQPQQQHAAASGGGSAPSTAAAAAANNNTNNNNGPTPVSRPPLPSHMMPFDVQQFNTERQARGIMSTISCTVNINFATNSGKQVRAFGKFCCGGKRTAGADRDPSLTDASNVGHEFECPFHTINARGTNNNNGSDITVNKIEKCHTGKLVTCLRNSRSSARKSKGIATWDCCGALAVVPHPTCTYQFFPEGSNGCTAIDDQGNVAAPALHRL